MIAAQDLTPERVRQWARRVPTLVLTLGPIVVAVLALASIWNEPGGLSGDVDEVTSWSAFLVGVPIGAALAALLFAWFVPRPGAWAMAVAVFPPLVGDDLFPNGANWFYVVAWVWVGIVLLDAVLVVRQREISSWMPASGPDTVRWQADHHLGVRLVAGVLLVAAMLTCLLMYVDWRGDARALAARAVRVEAPVVGVDTFFDSVYATVDGEKHEFFVNDARDHPVGSFLAVYRDPTGQMGPYNEEDADPAGWSDMGVPIGGAAFLLVVVVGEIGRRRRRIEHLATTGGPSTRVLARWHPVHEGLEVFAMDDKTGSHAVAYLPAIEPMVSGADPQPAGVRGGLHDLSDMTRFALGMPDGRSTDAASDQDHDLDAERDDDGFDALHEAVVVGMVSDGSVCVVRVVDGENELVLASVRPVRDRWTLKTVAIEALTRLLPGSEGKRKARGGARAHAATMADSDDEEATSPLLLRVATLFRRTASASVPTLVLLGWFGVPWMLDGLDPGFQDVAVALVAARLASWWWDLGRPRVTTAHGDLRLGGRWLDLHVSPAAITEVRRLAHEVVIELGEDEWYEFGEDLLLDEPERSRELDEVVIVVERARSEHRQEAGPETRRPRRLPSSTSYVALVVFCVWVAAALVG